MNNLIKNEAAAISQIKSKKFKNETLNYFPNAYLVYGKNGNPKVFSNDKEISTFYENGFRMIPEAKTEEQAWKNASLCASFNQVLFNASAQMNNISIAA